MVVEAKCIAEKTVHFLKLRPMMSDVVYMPHMPHAAHALVQTHRHWSISFPVSPLLSPFFV